MIRRFVAYCLLVLTGCTVFLSCTQTTQRNNFVDETRLLMGTVVRIVVYDQNKPESEIKNAVRSAFGKMAKIELQCSAVIESSEISQINQNAGIKAVTVSGDVAQILQTAASVSEISEGAFDISVLPVLSLWNFNSHNKKFRKPDSLEILEKLPFIDYKKIEQNGVQVKLPEKGMAIDIGGIAKGFAIDAAYDTLLHLGISDFMIDAGGDLRLHSGKVSRGKRRVWIKHPRKPGFLWGYFRQDDGCVATSGDYERFFMVDSVRYHHILDPKTGYPARGCLSVTTMASSAMRADALATAIFVLGPEKGLALAESLPDVEAVVLIEENSKLKSIASSGFKERIFEEVKEY